MKEFFKYFKGNVESIKIDAHCFQIDFMDYTYKFLRPNKNNEKNLISLIEGDIEQLSSNSKVLNLSMVFKNLVKNKKDTTLFKILIDYETKDDIDFIILDFDTSKLYSQCFKKSNNNLHIIGEIKLI